MQEFGRKVVMRECASSTYIIYHGEHDIAAACNPDAGANLGSKGLLDIRGIPVHRLIRSTSCLKYSWQNNCHVFTKMCLLIRLVAVHGPIHKAQHQQKGQGNFSQRLKCVSMKQVA